MVVDLLRGPGLLDTAFIHDDDPIGDLKRFFLIVRDEDRGNVNFGDEGCAASAAGPCEPWRRARQTARRAAEHAALSRAHEPARRVGAARRKAGRISLGKPAELERDRVASQHASRLPARSDVWRRGPCAQPERDVFKYRHMSKQRVMLKHKADMPLAYGSTDASSPSNRTSPWSGHSSPATMRSSVVFPEPDRPRSASNSPERTSRLTRSSAVKSPKRLVTSRTDIFMMSFSLDAQFEGNLDDERHERQQRRRRRNGESGCKLIAVVECLDVSRHGVGLAASRDRTRRLRRRTPPLPARWRVKRRRAAPTSRSGGSPQRTFRRPRGAQRKRCFLLFGALLLHQGNKLP